MPGYGRCAAGRGGRMNLCNDYLRSAAPRCCDGSPYEEPHSHFLTNVCERAARNATWVVWIAVSNQNLPGRGSVSRGDGESGVSQTARMSIKPAPTPTMRPLSALPSRLWPNTASRDCFFLRQSWLPRDSSEVLLSCCQLTNLIRKIAK